MDAQTHLQHALDLSYRYLGHRDRTVAEVRRHLEAKRVEPATIEAAVEELQEQGYLDDARFAQRFSEDRRSIDAWGADRIQRKLAAAGVAPDLIAGVLVEQPAGAELEAAIGVLRRRYAVPPATDRERERALGLLIRKGYDLELSHDAIRAFVRDAP